VNALKQQVNPVVATVAVILVLAVAGFLIWRGTSSGIGLPGAGEKGNPGPFAPGGAATKGYQPPAAGSAGPKNGNPGVPKSPTTSTPHS